MPDSRDRPSVPHSLRVPTDRQRAVARGESPPDPRTITISLDDVPEDLQAFARSTGLSIETLIKGFSLGAKVAVGLTRADDKLAVDLSKGKIHEHLDSIQGSIAAKRKLREWAYLAGLVVSVALAAGQGVWNIVAPKAREAAEVAVIAPAIEAKRVAEVIADKADSHAERLDAIEENQRDLAGALERLNGAVIALTSRLPDPAPTQVHVPASVVKPRRGGG